MTERHSAAGATTAERGAPDLSEKGGPIDGRPQSLDRRLFMQLTAFGGCLDWEPVAKALGGSGIEAVLYEDLNDPRGLAVLTMNEDPEDFHKKVRPLFNRPPFAALSPKAEYAMLGRTYALGYESNLEDWLLNRPRRVVSDPKSPWAVWYPLRRTGAFAQLPQEEQRRILGEHGAIGRRFGEAGLAQDIRLACHGLDKNDNDFVIGLIGPELHPLSALVQAMRSTRQTSTYMESMGPFFIGRAAWRSEAIK